MNQQTSFRIKLVVYAFVSFFVVAVILSILIALNMVGLEWAWEIAGVLVGILLYAILSRTRFGGRISVILLALFPIIGLLIERNRKREECHAIVNNMELTFRYYDLIHRASPCCPKMAVENNRFGEECKEQIVKRLMDETSGKDLVTSCSEMLSACMIKSIHPRVLDVLYYDRHKKFELTQASASTAYEDVKESRKAVGDLADILFHSSVFDILNDFDLIPPYVRTDDGLDEKAQPIATAQFPARRSDLVPLLLDMDEFTIEGIRDRVHRFKEVWKIANGYLAFLRLNQVPATHYTINSSEVFKTIQRKLFRRRRENQYLDILQDRKVIIPIILNEISTQLILSAAPKRGGPKPEWLEGISLISQIIFLHINHTELSEVQKHACRLAAVNETAVRMNLAYLLLRKNPPKSASDPGTTFISVKDIMEQGEKELVDRQKLSEDGYYKELAAVRANLLDGKWLNKIHLLREFIHQAMIEDAKDGIQRLDKLIDENPGIGAVLRRLFMDLNLETIERFLEARSVTAYLLTFDSSHGSMAELIDCFVNEDCRDMLKQAGIKTSHEGRPIYVFRDYTRNARLGIVPRGMTFDHFYRGFERDLKKLHKVYIKELDLPKNDLDDFEVIIHRFGLSGRDRHGFEGFNPAFRNKHALPKFRVLIAETHIPDDLLAVMSYEQRSMNGKENLAGILHRLKDEATIAELVSHKIEDLSRTERQLLEEKDTAIKRRLLSIMGLNKDADLGNALLDKDMKTLAKESLERVIGGMGIFKKRPEHCQQIAELYIETMCDLSMILQQIQKPKNTTKN